MKKLIQHDWPGNIRELKNVVERAAILCDGQQIESNSIIFSHEMGQQFSATNCHAMNPPADGQSLKESVSMYEKGIINNTLNASKSIRDAAKKLKISHTALLNKLKKYEIKMVIKRTTGNKNNH
jgi:transcriptional regulator of aroF, aroG, tyrA and aromatic amino acid transport